ncbi:hypothetical protein Cgig2_003243 [Carnegiea gigantea]|uniref:Uncharacterized protein n=1 Tax=Carnegiea gigantea TaxID=171969 RepID=A0A9Q1GU48_9CARY|nr:hypothetical protein Cgig2_003243 [Carnegiea gigantea]
MVDRVLVDTRSSVDIITLECLKKLQYNKKDLEAVESLVVGFGGEVMHPLGTKRLHDRRNNVIPMAYNASKGMKEETPTGDASQPNKKVAIEAVVVLSAATEKHGRPCPEPTSKVLSVPFDIICPEKIVQIGKGSFTSQPFKGKGHQGLSTPIGLEDTPYEVDRR